ncbi:MAG: hypothetical protein IK085_02870, partial [Clostridia bacterium]|nr:hypothetical protein [Clostridia bacterium]
NKIYQASSAVVDLFIQLGALDQIRMTSTNESNWDLPEVLEALAKANSDHALAYGDDEYTQRLEGLFKETFGEQARVSRIR